MRTTLILFDIDGTLVGGSRAGELAYVEAIERCYGLTVSFTGYSSAGKTDLLVMTELLTRQGVHSRDINHMLLTDAYLSALPEMLTVEPGYILPGVQVLLNQLAQRDDLVLGLGTGNLEQAAEMKLGVHNLHKYFTVGGYGSDAIDRKTIIAAGIRKAQACYTSLNRVIVIGDTPKDIQAGHANGAEVIAVATGAYDEKILESYHPDFVIPNLLETEALVSILTQQVRTAASARR